MSLKRYNNNKKCYKSNTALIISFNLLYWFITVIKKEYSEYFFHFNIYHESNDLSLKVGLGSHETILDIFFLLIIW